MTDLNRCATPFTMRNGNSTKIIGKTKCSYNCYEISVSTATCIKKSTPTNALKYNRNRDGNSNCRFSCYNSQLKISLAKEPPPQKTPRIDYHREKIIMLLTGHHCHLYQPLAVALHSQGCTGRIPFLS